MHAIIFVDRNGEELWPLTSRRPVALLPVGNKPLMQIALEELYALGIRDATIFSRSFTNEIMDYFADGKRFGMTLYHVSISEEISLREAVARSAMAADDDWVAVRGDMLRPMGFLKEALARRSDITSADIFLAMGIALPDRHQPFGHDISWAEVCKHCNLHPCLVDSLSTYHSANVLALRGLVPGIRLPGRKLPDETIVGAGSVVWCRKAPDTAINIGERCKIFGSTEIGSNTIIGHGSIVQCGTKLSNVVILPGTYVGKHLTVEDAIVDGNLVICSRTGAITTFPDSSIFGSTGINFLD